MSKIKNQPKTNNGKKTTLKQQQKSKSKSIIWATLCLILVVGLSVGIYFMFNNLNNEQTVTRYEDLTHIKFDQYQALLSDDKKALEELNVEIKHDVYVFVYNEDYDACTTCAELESSIQEKALKEGRTYTFFVLNYTKYPQIKEQLEDNFLPNMPVLVHIEGETINEGKIYLNKLEIQSALSKL